MTLCRNNWQIMTSLCVLLFILLWSANKSSKFKIKISVKLYIISNFSEKKNHDLCWKFLIHIFIYFFFIFTFLYISRRKYGFRAKFLFPVFDGFNVLGCPEHDLTISGKCLSVCLYVCVSLCVCVTKILWQV